MLPAVHQTCLQVADYAIRHVETLKLINRQALEERLARQIKDWNITESDELSRDLVARIVMVSLWDLHPLQQKLTRQMAEFSSTDPVAESLIQAFKLLPARLIEVNWELVRKAAGKYHIVTQVENEAEFQELMSVGREALFLAAQKYFRRPKGPFKNFAWTMLREAMRDEQMGRHPIPPRVRKKLSALSRLREDHALRDLKLDALEIQKQLKLSTEECRELLATEAVWGTGQAFEHDHVLEELEEPDHSADQLAMILDVESARELEAALAVLKAPEALLVRKVYFEEKSYREAADELGLSLPAFKRMHRTALSDMRQFFDGVR